jgi:acyl carrier protein
LLDIDREVLGVLVTTLNLKAGAGRFRADSPLLGAIPELDSMAVATVITSLEERFGFMVADDEIDGSTFATVGTLTEFVKSKLADSAA